MSEGEQQAATETRCEGRQSLPLHGDGQVHSPALGSNEATIHWLSGILGDISATCQPAPALERGAAQTPFPAERSPHPRGHGGLVQLQSRWLPALFNPAADHRPQPAAAEGRRLTNAREPHGCEGDPMHHPAIPSSQPHQLTPPWPLSHRPPAHIPHTPVSSGSVSCRWNQPHHCWYQPGPSLGANRSQHCPACRLNARPRRAWDHVGSRAQPQAAVNVACSPLV